MTFPERFSEVIVDFPRKKILTDKNGSYTSDEVFRTAQFVAAEILNHQSFKGERICLLAPPGLSYVSGMLGGMMSGAMMVPLCIDHPKAELEHVIEDSSAKIILVHPDLIHLLDGIVCQKKKLIADSPPKEPVPYNWDYPKPSDNALMLYTSGTTGKPKGVVHTHASLASQISCLVEAWEWTDEDSILHFLPHSIFQNDFLLGKCWRYYENKIFRVLLTIPIDGFWFCRITCFRFRKMENNFRTHFIGTLWNDRNRNGFVESIAG
ncbi:MAG: AMP-binding protein [Bacteroidetes bacterium]|nr:AMP-binding protein [Bacteroidota bacterium]